ncbi:MAG: hypothetical protein RIQ60_1330 [Pseudomonadota bacterium]
MKRLGPRLVAWLGLAFSLLILAVLLARLDWAQFRRAAAEVPLWAWAGGSAGVLASHVLRALRLRSEWRPRTGATLGECLRLALLHNAAVLLLPFRSGEAGYAWWLHRSWGVSLAEALHSLLWLRLQDLAVLGLLAVLLLLPVPLPVAALLTLALGGLLVLGVPALLHRLAARYAVDDPTAAAAPSHATTAADTTPTAAAPRGALGKTLARVTGKLLQALAARRSGVSSWLFAVTNWSLRLLVVGGLLVALGVVDLAAGLRGALGGELGALSPLQGPAGLGTYEAGVWAGAAWHGVTSTAAALSTSAGVAELAGAALAVHAMWLATGLVAAAFAALLPRLFGWPTRRVLLQHPHGQAASPSAPP